MADKVKIEFTGDGAGFHRETEKIKQSVTGLKNELLGNLKTAMFAAFSVEALKKFDDEFKEFVERIEIARKQTGANSTDLQVWDKQMQKIGGSMEDVTRMINKLAVARDKALEDPSGKESKAFEKLGMDRSKLVTSDASDLFKELQEQISKTGTAIGAMGPMMDIFGDKSVKNLALFVDSFTATEDKLKKTGKLIDSEIITRYKEITRLNKEINIGDALMGGPKSKAEGLTELKEAWVGFKSGLQFVSLFPAQVSDALGFSQGKVKSIWSNIQDTQTGLTLAGRRSIIDSFSPTPAGLLSPSQYDAIRNKTLTEQVNRQEQWKRIDDLRNANAEKALTDQEKLTRLYKEQENLLNKMQKLEQNKSKRTEFIATLEDYLRMVPKVMDLKEKVEKENTTKKEKADKEKESRDKLLGNYMEKVKEHYSPYQMQDSLVSTGNFLGTSRSRLESLSSRQTELLEAIEQNTRAWLEKNKNVTSLTEFPDL